jgi:hypothetical protein
MKPGHDWRTRAAARRVVGGILPAPEGDDRSGRLANDAIDLDGPSQGAPPAPAGRRTFTPPPLHHGLVGRTRLIERLGTTAGQSLVFLP